MRILWSKARKCLWIYSCLKLQELLFCDLRFGTFSNRIAVNFKSNHNRIVYVQVKNLLLFKSDLHKWFNRDLNRITILICPSPVCVYVCVCVFIGNHTGWDNARWGDNAGWCDKFADRGVCRWCLKHQIVPSLRGWKGGQPQWGVSPSLLVTTHLIRNSEIMIKTNCQN